jgi:hypothetical protein
MEAVDVIKRLPALLDLIDGSEKSISCIFFARYPWRPDRELRLTASSEPLRRLFDSARRLREAVGPTLTKQQSVDLACTAADEQTVIDTMTDVLIGHRGESTLSPCPVSQLSEIIDHELNQYPIDKGFLSVSSRCELRNGCVAHIPMMDLACPPSPNAERWVRAALQKLAPYPWALLDSGASYHFYGAALLDQKTWHEFLARWLLFSPFVDTRYVGHACLDGACALRLSGSKSGGGAPRVVASREFF